MDREHDLLIRGEREREHASEFDEPSRESAPPQGSMVEDALASTVTPGMSEAEAAELVEQLPEEEHEKIYEWLTEHLGGDFADRVTDLADLQVTQNFAQEHDLESVLDEAFDSFVGDDLDMGLDEPIASFSDPLMGDMEACVSTGAGFEVSVSEYTVSVQSPQGIGLRLGNNTNASALASGFRFNLQDSTLDIDGAALSEVEHALLTQTLQNAFGTIVSRRNRAMTNELSELPLQAERLSLGVDGQLQATEAFLEAQLNAHGVDVTFAGTLELQAPGFAPVPLSGISYDFATGSVHFSTFASGTFEPEDLQALIGAQGAQLAQEVLLRRLPAAMRTLGYTPSQDPNFADNLQSFLAQYTPTKPAAPRDLEPLEAQKEKRRGEDRTPEHETPADDKKSVQKKTRKKNHTYILLWEIEDPMLGLVRVLMRRKDQLSLTCSATTTTIKTRFGLSLDVEGSPWTRSLKVLSLLLDHTTKVVRWVSLTPLPDAVQRVADVLLRTRLGPLLPQPSKGSDASRHVLVQNATTAQPFQAWKEAQDTLTLSIHDTSLRVSCPQGVTLVSQERTTMLTEASRDLDTGALHTANAHSVEELETISAWLYSLPGIELSDL